VGLSMREREPEQQAHRPYWPRVKKGPFPSLYKKLPAFSAKQRKRKRGELCFLCPNQTRNKREGKEKRKEKKETAGERESCDFRERKTELEIERGCFR
jgi:hypothetical protein